MDWQLIIDRNAAALKRIVAALAAMAGIGGQFTFLPTKPASAQNEPLGEKSKLSPALTLPRCVHRAVLRLLRPAEAAARRLVVIAARDIVAPPPRPARAKPAPPWTIVRTRPAAALRAVGQTPRARPCRLRLALLDPLPHPTRRTLKMRGPGSSGVPRILFPGVTTPHPVAPWQPPSPDDPLDAARLRLRIAAIGAALDDLPGEALRLARWRARRDAALAAGTRHRQSPLRPGRVPGVSRRRARRPSHEVDNVALDLHHFARQALRPPDTS